MRLSRAARVTLGTVTTLILAVIYLPLFVVFVNSFSTSTNLTWPPPGFTLEWWGKAFQNAGALEGIQRPAVPQQRRGLAGGAPVLKSGSGLHCASASTGGGRPKAWKARRSQGVPTPCSAV